MGILADFFVSTTEDALLYEKLLGDEKPLPESRYVRIESGRFTGLTETITDLRSLAHAAIESERDLFLWGSL